MRIDRIRPWRLVRLAALAVCSLTLLPDAAADDPVFPVGRRDRPVVRVPRLSRSPLLEEFESMAPPPGLRDELVRITGFVQRTPEDGRPASQKTDVYLGYSEETLFVVFVAWDEEPRKIRAHLSRREQVFADETVEIQLDTFDDEQRAYSFLTNPFGIQWDAIWTEGQGFDSSWDTVWQSRGVLTDRGYVVLMAIPFKSLRFRPRDGDDQTWGVVLVRDIPRNNETSFWPRVSNTIEGRLNQAATVEGFSGVAPGRNLWLIPYAAASFDRFRPRPDGQPVNLDERDVGIDTKWVIRDSLTLDVTLNPNFAQIESDNAQVTVNQRFEVFFPERRPFFLENADFFRTPLDLLFTRRIVDPQWGSRLTGQLGRFKLGAFVIDDEFPGKQPDAPEELRGERAVNTIFRLRRDLPNQSHVGVLFTDRELAGSYNRVGSLDARIKLGTNWDTQLHGVHSASREEQLSEPSAPDVEFDGGALSAAVNRVGRKLNVHMHYVDIGPEFETALGFIPRNDIRDAHAQVEYNFWPEKKGLLRWSPRLFVQQIDNHDGVRLDRGINPGIEFEFRRRTQFGFFARLARERLIKCRDYLEPSCSSDVPATLPDDLDFDVGDVGISVASAFIAPIDFELDYVQGNGINLRPAAGLPPSPADRRALDAGLTLRLGRRWRITNEWLHTELDDRASGDRIFTNRIFRSRLDFQLDPRFSLRVIGRYDRTDVDPDLTSIRPQDAVNLDFLVTYLINPWTAFYVGYNTNSTQNALVDAGGIEFLDDRFTNANMVFFKVSYLFRP